MTLSKEQKKEIAEVVIGHLQNPDVEKELAKRVALWLGGVILEDVIVHKVREEIRKVRLEYSK